METETEDKFTLFTNIQFVTINGVRTHTHALLLEDTESLFARKDRCYQLRGFSVDETVPSFDFALKSPNYTSTPAHSSTMFVSKSTLRPLLTGHILQFENGPRVDPLSRPILRVWARQPCNQRLQS